MKWKATKLFGLKNATLWLLAENENLLVSFCFYRLRIFRCDNEYSVQVQVVGEEHIQDGPLFGIESKNRERKKKKHFRLNMKLELPTNFFRFCFSYLSICNKWDRSFLLPNEFELVSPEMFAVHLPNSMLKKLLLTQVMGAVCWPWKIYNDDDEQQNLEQPLWNGRQTKNCTEKSLTKFRHCHFEIFVNLKSKAS